MASNPSTGWRCWLGRIPGEADDQAYHVRLLPSHDNRQIQSREGVWILGSSCLFLADPSRIEIELWTETIPGVEREAVARAPLTGLAPTRVPMALEVSPSPATSSCRIRFFLPQPGPARVSLYDVHGRRIRDLADGAYPAGWHTVTWNRSARNAEPVSTGIYFAVVATPEGREVARVAVLR